MPIRIPDALPATAALESENIFVMTEYRALHQDKRVAGAAGLRGSAGTHVRRLWRAVRYGTGSHRANLPARTFVSYHRGM